MPDQSEIIRRMVEAGRKASKEIVRIYKEGFTIRSKEDDSPVTSADLASDSIIRSTLEGMGIAYLSEEEEDDLSRLEKRALFIVDPLDGTQDFVNRDGSFSVNIAYVEDHEVVIGCIFLPTKDSYCYAIKGKGSFLVENGKERRIHVSGRKKDLVYLASKTHENEREKAIYLDHSDIIARVERLGASMKGVALASGEGDASIRFTTMTKEWDTCAMDLIVREAGGIFLDTKKRPFSYNRKDVYNRDGYCMFNSVETCDRLLPSSITI